MCTSGCLEFGAGCLTAEAVRGRRVLEVGARCVDFSLRPHVAALGPAEIVGVDLEPGEGVDEIADANHLIERFGAESFDLVISTEMLEHVPDWRNVIRNLKGVVRRGGRLLITARAKGFRIHGYPQDFWRFETDDLREIFADFRILRIESDPGEPGAFLYAEKPEAYAERPPSELALYSVVARKRVPRLTRLHRFLHHLRHGPVWLLSCLEPATLKRIIAKRIRGKAR